MLKTLTPLAAFCAVVEKRSLTAGARSLGLPKSTVSRWITELEQQLDVRLVERAAHALIITDAGRALHASASAGLATVRKALETAQGAREDVSGLVRITATPDVGELLVAPVLTRFVRAHPRVRVELSLTRRRVDLVAERFDIALRIGPLQDSTLIARRLCPMGRRLVASPGYLKKHGTPRNPEALREHACLAFQAVDGETRWDFYTDGRRRAVTLSPRLTTEDFRLLRRWASAGLGIAMLPAHWCEEAIDQGKLVSVLEKHLPADEALYVVHTGASHVPLRIRALVQALSQAITARG